MSLKRIVNLEFNSKLIRSVLGLYYKEGKYYNIPSGALKGFKSYYQKDVNFHAILGLWEKDSLQILLQLIKQFELDKRKIIVADVGANMGYYSMFFTKYLHADAKIFAFEPSESVLNIIKNNFNINNLKNIELIEKACSDKEGEITFYIGQHHHQSSVVAEWAEGETKGKKTVVRATSLDDFFYNQKKASLPDIIKMDIEGGAVFGLKGCEKCITEKRPFIIIESHTAAEDAAISEVLLKHKYEAYRLNSKSWVLKKDKNYLEKDGVWGTMLLLPDELRNKFTI